MNEPNLQVPSGEGLTLARGKWDLSCWPAVQQERNPQARCAAALRESDSTDEAPAARKDACGATDEEFWHFGMKDPKAAHPQLVTSLQQPCSGWWQGQTTQKDENPQGHGDELSQLSSPSCEQPAADWPGLRTVTNGWVFEAEFLVFVLSL